MRGLPGGGGSQAGEIIAEAGNLDQAMRECFLSSWFVVDETMIEHAKGFHHVRHLRAV